MLEGTHKRWLSSVAYNIELEWELILDKLTGLQTMANSYIRVWQTTVKVFGAGKTQSVLGAPESVLGRIILDLKSSRFNTHNSKVTKQAQLQVNHNYIPSLFWIVRWDLLAMDLFFKGVGRGR